MLDASRGPLRGIHALVVEDHADTLDLYGQILAAQGALVTGAPTPEGALDLCGTLTPHVIVTDLGFGAITKDGVWLLQQLRARKELARVPVIVTTGRGLQDSDREKWRFDALLLKPVEPPQLVDAVGLLALGPREWRLR